MCLWDENLLQFEFPGELKIEFFSQETCNFQSLENETLIIAGYVDIKIFIFHYFVTQVWLKEDDDLHTITLDHHSFKGTNVPQIENSAFFEP